MDIGPDHQLCYFLKKYLVLHGCQFKPKVMLQCTTQIGTFLAAIQYFPIRKRKVGKEGARWKLLFRRHFETPSYFFGSIVK